jgi:hypothetical protein
MRNFLTIVHKYGISTSGTCNKLREVDSCLDINTNTTISTMVMASSGLCGMKCSLLKGGELGAQIICLWEL